MPPQTHSEARRLAIALYIAAKDHIRAGMPLEDIQRAFRESYQRAESTGNIVDRDAYAEVLDQLDADALPRKAFSVDNSPAQVRNA